MSNDGTRDGEIHAPAGTSHEDGSLIPEVLPSGLEPSSSRSVIASGAGLAGSSPVPPPVSPPAPRDFDPGDYGAERARLLRAAGIDPVQLVQRAIRTTERALDSKDLEHALRAADQAYRLTGVYAGKPESGRGGKVDVNVVLAPWARVNPVPDAGNRD